MISPIKDVLQTLGRHGETIEHALQEVVSHHSGEATTAINALRQVSALRAVGRDGYRLHPRLKEYLQDHLQAYPAFQRLDEIGSRITNMRSHWHEVDRLIFQQGDQEAIAAHIIAIHSDAFDILDSMDRNVALLHTLLSTRYGNVKSLAIKQGQNRYYDQQSKMLALDLSRLSNIGHEIEKESAERGLEEISTFMRHHLLVRILPWQEGLSELQTQIRQDIFRTRRIEQDSKYLTRLDVLLRNQPAWRGFDVELSGHIPDFLLAASIPALRPNIDLLDTEYSMQKEMEDLARSLPPMKAPAPDPEPPQRHKRIRHEAKPVQIPPASIALSRLTKDLQAADKGISLCEWQLTDTDAMTMSSAVWLVFSLMALRSDGYQVNMVFDPPRPGERRSHTFNDAFAYTTKLTESVGRRPLAA